jgi:hypothetical protein
MLAETVGPDQIAEVLLNCWCTLWFFL